MANVSDVRGTISFTDEEFYRDNKRLLGEFFRYKVFHGTLGYGIDIKGDFEDEPTLSFTGSGRWNFQHIISDILSPQYNELTRDIRFKDLYDRLIDELYKYGAGFQFEYNEKEEGAELLQTVSCTLYPPVDSEKRKWIVNDESIDSRDYNNAEIIDMGFNTEFWDINSPEFKEMYDAYLTTKFVTNQYKDSKPTYKNFLSDLEEELKYHPKYEGYIIYDDIAMMDPDGFAIDLFDKYEEE